MDDDVAGTGEEDFALGMQRSAMEYDAHDVDGDQRLDFGEFCAMVREREDGEHTDEELKARFKALDADGSGQVDFNEYVSYSLCDALQRSSSKVIDLFKTWDEDGSGEVDKKEFRRAIKSMGFDFFANDAEIDMVFEGFDLDSSGTITYKELNTALRKIKPPPTRALRRTEDKKNSKSRSAFDSAVQLNMDSDVPIQEQIVELMQKHRVQVIKLFQDWDDDGNGEVSKKEFRKAIAALGVNAPANELNALFDTFDTDKSGSLEYKELQKVLSRKATPASRGGKKGPFVCGSPAPVHPSQDMKMVEKADVFDVVTLTAPDGKSPMKQQLLPKHCVQFTKGSQLHQELITDTKDLQSVHGTNAAVGSFCAFHDRHALKKTGLLKELKDKGITHLYICGLALDHAVVHSALAAAEAGFCVSVVEDACRGASDEGIASARASLSSASVRLCSSQQMRRKRLTLRPTTRGRPCG